ncbi:trans-aconitate methyltransferase 2 [Castilleja foliolosa]|uniref:Trans-aconitate methyltransferase 2 n=1 Tax=Castilleja foliolosa TaxID=1961234 RepID=A0ABD3DZZ0_9LAMI
MFWYLNNAKLGFFTKLSQLDGDLIHQDEQIFDSEHAQKKMKECEEGIRDRVRVLQQLRGREDVSGEIALLVEVLAVGAGTSMEEYIIGPDDDYQYEHGHKDDPFKLYGLEAPEAGLSWVALRSLKLVFTTICVSEVPGEGRPGCCILYFDRNC